VGESLRDSILELAARQIRVGVKFRDRNSIRERSGSGGTARAGASEISSPPPMKLSENRSGESIRGGGGGEISSRFSGGPIF